MIAGIININKDIIRPAVTNLCNFRIFMNENGPRDIFDVINHLLGCITLNDILAAYDDYVYKCINICLQKNDTLVISGMIVNLEELNTILGKEIIQSRQYYFYKLYRDNYTSDIYSLTYTNGHIYVYGYNNIVKLFISWRPKITVSFGMLKLGHW